MAIPGFFKQNKPRGFNYVPRYYDPVKEELEERRKAWSNQETPEGKTRSAEPGEHGSEAAGSKAGNAAGAKASDYTSGPDRTTTTGLNQPYRSKIMRGDMKNYFHRRQERVQKYTLIKVLAIAVILILIVYLYLRF